MQYPQCSWWEPCQNSRSSDPSCPCPSRKPRGMSQGHAQSKDFGMEIPGVGPDHCGYGPVCTSQPRDESPSPPESHKSQISSSTPTAGLQDLCGAQGNLIYPASFVSVTPPRVAQQAHGLEPKYPCPKPPGKQLEWVSSASQALLQHFPTGAVNPTLVMGREAKLRQLQRRKVAREPQKKLCLRWFGSF